MNRQQVREAVNRLVETKFDRDEAQKRLDRFTQLVDPPRAPGEFKTLQDFLDFHEVKQGYEDEEQSLRTEVANTKAAYGEAENTLMGILPENAPLYYQYEGERQEFAGLQFSIVNRRLNRQREMIVASSGPARGPSGA